MNERPRLIGTSTTNSFTINAEQLGAPGTLNAFTIVPILLGEETADENKITNKKAKAFICTAQLVRESSLKAEIDGAFTANDGGSFMSSVAGANGVEVNTSSGTININSNKVGELSLVTMTVVATGLAEAMIAFRAAITPLLDHLAYIANVPVRTNMFKIYDQENNVQSIIFINPFPQMTVNAGVGVIHSELEPVYALYREARNSESPYYQLLCHFKIMEAISKLKARILKKARKHNVELSPVQDTVPDHPNLAGDLRQHVGKSVKQFQDAVLARRYRDAVAHFQLTDSSVLHVSSPKAFTQFTEAAFAAELCARTMIANYEMLAHAAAAISAGVA